MRHYATSLKTNVLALIVLDLLPAFGLQLASGLQVVTVISALDVDSHDDSIAFMAQTSILGLSRCTALLTSTHKSPR